MYTKWGNLSLLYLFSRIFDISPLVWFDVAFALSRFDNFRVALVPSKFDLVKPCGHTHAHGVCLRSFVKASLM